MAYLLQISISTTAETLNGGYIVKHISLFVRVLVMLTWGFVLTGCTSSHQIFKYENPIQNIHNLIPGVEPGESDNKITISVFGQGFDPQNGTVHQKRYMAERAATIDGYRRLSERLAGIVLNAYTKSGITGISEDQVTSETNAYLRGAQARLISYKNGVATVNTKVFIEPRQVKAYHGSKVSRALLTALAGASLGAAAGTVSGLAVGATSAEIEAAAAIGAGMGAVAGGAYSTH